MEKSCLYCRNTNIIKRGKRITKNRGLIQRYSCKDCKRRFTLNDGFYKMRNTPEKITEALNLYFSGVSLRKTQEHLGVFYNHNCSYVTILKWIRKYCNQIKDYTEKLKLNTSEQIQVDEMEFKTKGKKSWFIDVIDANTRFMLASGYFKNRGKKEITEILKSVREKSQDNIKEVYTDGWLVYPYVLRKIFGLNKIEGKSKIKHFQNIGSEGRFNHKIERLHNSIRERTKIFRNFKRLESAKAIMNGYEIYYNFIRKHQAIGCCPYELALPYLKLKNKNKWLDLMRLSQNH